jgi:hypothetical protein
VAKETYSSNRDLQMCGCPASVSVHANGESTSASCMCSTEAILLGSSPLSSASHLCPRGKGARGLISFASRTGKGGKCTRMHTFKHSFHKPSSPTPLRRSLSRYCSLMHLSVSRLRRLLRIDLQQVKAVCVCVCVLHCVCVLCVYVVCCVYARVC